MWLQFKVNQLYLTIRWIFVLCDWIILLQAPPTEDTLSLVDDVFFDEPPLIGDTVKTLDKIPEEEAADKLPSKEGL